MGSGGLLGSMEKLGRMLGLSLPPEPGAIFSPHPSEKNNLPSKPATTHPYTPPSTPTYFLGSWHPLMLVKMAPEAPCKMGSLVTWGGGLAGPWGSYPTGWGTKGWGDKNDLMPGEG